MRVLKRRSIRTKLMVGLALLSASVVLLAFTGLSGLYRYRYLANAINQRGDETRLAYAVHQHAESLLESHLRLFNLYLDEDGFIDSRSSLVNMQQLEQTQISTEIDLMEAALAAYDETIRQAASNYCYFEDHASQLRTLGMLKITLDDIKRFRDDPLPLAFLHHSNLTDILESQTERLKALVEQTNLNRAELDKTMKDFTRTVNNQARTWIVFVWCFTITAFGIVAALLVMFRSLVVKPFQTLLHGSRLVAGGQFDHRIDLGTGDELSELALAMNDMTDRFQGALARVNSLCEDLDQQVQERTREVIQNEQLASVGFLAAGVAHEINNPLATIAWSAESLVSRVAESAMTSPPQDDDDGELTVALKTNLQRIEEEAYRCKGITEKLLDFSRLSEVRRAPTDLVELVNDVVSMVGKVGKFRCKTIRVHAKNPVVVDVNPQEIRQVVLNLVSNALESVESEGAVEVRVRVIDQSASVSVEDNGCGMTQEVLRHLFEPFFTRRRDGTGTGLGLSITYRIVSQHGGSLVASSEGEGRGSQMEMRLPLQGQVLEPGGRSLNRELNRHEKHQAIQ